MSRGTTLAELPVGGRGVLGAPSRLDATLVRLLELGLTEGTAVELTRRGPGGDPLEIRLRGTRLCLRRAEADAFSLQSSDDGRGAA